MWPHFCKNVTLLKKQQTTKKVAAVDAEKQENSLIGAQIMVHEHNCI